MDKWNNWYSKLDKNSNPSSFKYGDTISYIKGYEFLKDCKNVEDWGCGGGGFKRFFLTDNERYIGIDGSNTPFADKKVDLLTYNSKVEGIFMRHVLEHNYDWRTLFNNALNSFTKKMCLVLFTPFLDKETELAHNAIHGVDVPDLAFNKEELIKIVTDKNIKVNLETFNSNTFYGLETVLYLEK